MSGRKVKIGIDVGGTFTHSVAIDAEGGELIGKAMVPTTHTAREGVALGVVQSMQKLIDLAHIYPQEVILIAHSTTQATNALLEGDVATVGIIGMAKGIERFATKVQARLGKIFLAPHKFLNTVFQFIDITNGIDYQIIREAVQRLHIAGAQVFVTTEAFGVDDQSNEQRAAEIVRDMGFQCTAASEVSQLYGLRARTLTAAINASMLPKMLETADMTEKSVRDSGIRAPLMVMRSDGGIMGVSEMRRRPILTILSGPAAGVTAALMYARVSEGIFIEVGGTSTDISVIVHGKPFRKAAEVGGNKIYLRTLDVRTVGIGGGSMVRFTDGKVADVGPRSAHIANLRYLSFCDPEEIRGPVVKFVKPLGSDPSDYLSFSTQDNPDPQFALTATDAANFLGVIEGSYARGNVYTLKRVFEELEKNFKREASHLAKDILDKATDKIISVVERLIDEYKLDESARGGLVMVGGGGGAGVLVPYVARRLGTKYVIAENSEVVSAIGVALGLIQETVERNAPHPTRDDVLRVRQEAIDSVLRMGAAAETVEVHVEVDSHAKSIRAIASGSTEMRTRNVPLKPLTVQELREKAESFSICDKGTMSLVGKTNFLYIFQGLKRNSYLLGLFSSVSKPVVVVDQTGVARLNILSGEVRSTDSQHALSFLEKIIEDSCTYGDAGVLPPNVFAIVAARIIDLTGLINRDQILGVAGAEFQNVANDEPVVFVYYPRRF